MSELVLESLPSGDVDVVLRARKLQVRGLEALELCLDDVEKRIQARKEEDARIEKEAKTKGSVVRRKTTGRRTVVDAKEVTTLINAAQRIIADNQRIELDRIKIQHDAKKLEKLLDLQRGDTAEELAAVKEITKEFHSLPEKARNLDAAILKLVSRG